MARGKRSAPEAPSASASGRGDKKLKGEWTEISILGKDVVMAGYGVLRVVPEDLKTRVKASKYVLVTDENVAEVHLAQVTQIFQERGIQLLTKVIPSGESSKNRGVKEDIENWMLSMHCGRDTCLIALGGGVVGDLVGFVAATFLRGIPFVQMPTSLLAMVDSSIGGKTGLDTPHGKNLIGAFHQPGRIYIDLAFLKTLPERQFFNGMAEVIKTAAIYDEATFKFLEDNADEILAGNEDLVAKAVLGSVAVKAEVVTQDEKEGGLREILNYGHSIGHAIEALMQPGMLHGEAVSIGMVKEGELARNLGHLSQASLGRMTRCLQAYHLPVVMPKGLAVEDLMEKMAVDKKNKGGKKAVVLLRDIGVLLERKATLVEDEPIEKILSLALEVVPLQPVINVSIRVPGSKSISNRALLLAAMGAGVCQITGLLHSDDTQVMIEALQQLGVKQFKWGKGGATLTITGCHGEFKAPKSEVYLGNAGTAARFLATVGTLVKGDQHTVITGNKRMKERPIGPLIEALRANGCEIEYLEREGCLPLKIKNECLLGGKINLSAKISSQYVSSVLLAAPHSKNATELTLLGGEVVSEPYIDMTIGMMQIFGVTVTADKIHRVYSVPKGGYKNPRSYAVEADASSATYPLAIAAITGGTVKVEGIGSHSLQGDSQFYRLLEKMGCTVKQEADATTVTGPAKGMLKAIKVDMGDMTDAFMTAAVLMAVAEGTSEITNIANQRVKESNRIAVMVEELGKCGVEASELPDGIKITGSPYTALKGATISCHDDHRIAMSFAVLGCLTPGIVISDKACVEKTYPEFWDDLEGVLSGKVRVPKSGGQGVADEPQTGARKTLVLIGMRGAGKTHLGRAAAAATPGFQFIDMDQHFEKVKSVPIMEFVKLHDWPAFRVEERSLLAEVLKAHPSGAVVSCGGGIVETEEGRSLLRKHGLVVEIRRHLEDIVNYLTTDKSRPHLGEPPQDVYKRRALWYVECSKFEFVVREGEKEWKRAERDFVRLVNHVTGVRPKFSPAFWTPLGGQFPARYQNSFFLSLTFPDLKEAIAILPEISEGADALEIRADLFERCEADFIRDQLSLIRCHTHLPLIFTVRSCGQGGKFPDDEKKIFELLELGVRLGCEYVDMELCWSLQARTALLSGKGTSKIIASFHDPKGQLSWSELRLKFEEAAHRGSADVVKIVALAKSFEDNEHLAKVLRSLPNTTPTIAICMGELGRLSRALNTFMTPVTHPKLPTKAAPGQLSVKEILKMRHDLGLLPEGKLVLFGHPISQSMSPTLHNAGFEALGLPHKYSLSESVDLTHVREVLQSPGFLGASVTIPHKESIIPLLHSISPAAKAIGAVNTVAKIDGLLYGDNTDWLGIGGTVAQRLHRTPQIGLVIGAGGTARAACHALRELKVTTVLLYNRTKEKADLLAKEFGATVCDDLSLLRDLDVIIGTIPAPAQSDALFPESLFASSPVVVELAYRPRKTLLLKKAEKAECPTVEGIQILIEQGLYQFKTWTCCNPPAEKMAQAVQRAYKD